MHPFLSILLIIFPAVSMAAPMNMAVAWFNVGKDPGTCTVQEGQAISALMVAQLDATTTSLSVIGGGGGGRNAWDSGYEGNRRSLTVDEEEYSEEDEDERELCTRCRSVCSYNFYECKYVYNCCPCGYCRRLSLRRLLVDVSASVVAASLESTCESVLWDIVKLNLPVNISTTCMASLKGSVCQADVSMTN